MCLGFFCLQSETIYLKFHVQKFLELALLQGGLLLILNAVRFNFFCVLSFLEIFPICVDFIVIIIWEVRNIFTWLKYQNNIKNILIKVALLSHPFHPIPILTNIIHCWYIFPIFIFAKNKQILTYFLFSLLHKRYHAIEYAFLIKQTNLAMAYLVWSPAFSNPFPISLTCCFLP